MKTLLTADIDTISNSHYALDQILTSSILIGGCFGYLFHLNSNATWIVVLVILVA